MLRNKWVLLYIAVAGLTGFLSDKGILGAISVILVAPGEVLRIIVGQKNNDAVLWGGSLLFWLGLHFYFKYKTPAPDDDGVLISRRSIETIQE